MGQANNAPRIGESADFALSRPSATGLDAPAGLVQPSGGPVILLSSAHPVASGRTRLVFAHPQNPGWLIKIIRTDTEPTRYWYKKKRRYGPFLPTLREIREFLALHASQSADLDLIERIVGFEQTDLGLGFVVEALTDRAGDHAPTLANLLRTCRFDETAAAKLETYFEKLVASAIIIGDMHAANLVYAYDAKAGSDRFVMVDGIGEKLFVPLSTISPAFRRWNKKRRIRKLRAQMAAIRAKSPPKA